MNITIKPSPEIVGYKEERDFLLKYILSGNPCMLIGNYGTGKTSLLLWSKKKLENSKRVIYIEGDVIQDVESLLKTINRNLTFFEKLFKKEFPDNSIIIVDEADKMDEKALLYIKNIYDKNKIFNFVLSVINENTIPDSILHRIGSRKIILKGVREEDVYEFAKLKLGEEKFDMFKKESLLEIWKLSNANPRKMLEIFERLILEAEKENIKLIDKDFVYKVLGVSKNFKEEKKKEEKLDITAKELMQNEIKLSPIQQKIVEALSEGPKTLKELSEILNTSVHSVGARISELKKLNLIEETGGRPKRYILKQNILSGQSDNLNG